MHILSFMSGKLVQSSYESVNMATERTSAVNMDYHSSLIGILLEPLDNSKPREIHKFLIATYGS